MFDRAVHLRLLSYSLYLLTKTGKSFSSTLGMKPSLGTSSDLYSQISIPKARNGILWICGSLTLAWIGAWGFNGTQGTSSTGSIGYDVAL